MARAGAGENGPNPETAGTRANIAGPWVADADLPPLSKAVELMWGLAPAATRGPRRGLSLEQIVDAAIELADEEGFDALSMNRLAERLGFTAMSLYRYVDSKATLLEIALDRVVGSPPEIPPGTPWRAALELWARAEFRTISKHSGWLHVRMSAPPLGPNNMAWLETGLAALGETRVPEPLKLQLVMNLSLYVIGRARLAEEIKAEDEESEGDWGIVDRLDPERFPALITAVRAQAFEQDDQQWATLFFDTGLDLLLDGYERLIDSYE
ncbi:TetR/AcrR family transcriptional regulator [Nocardia carnea]|uniref:TetR/AcrR family transcriptional regulator n=1 Tax=Nocardia carnea TaxID=37328 RepID=UPI0024585D40|nr:TetR/AcrR family transcriptional regulator [Nocardia carnea]